MDLKGASVSPLRYLQSRTSVAWREYVSTIRTPYHNIAKNSTISYSVNNAVRVVGPKTLRLKGHKTGDYIVKIDFYFLV